jgi:hypothetical protein
MRPILTKLPRKASRLDVSNGFRLCENSDFEARRMGGAKRYPSFSETAMGFAKGSTHPTCPLILPDGQITSCFPKWPVQPPLQKYFRSCLTQITSISLTVSFHRGAIARRHERGAGCGGRESARRATAIAGRDEPRERSASARDDRRFSGRQSRVVLTPVAGVKFAEASRPDRVRQNLNPRTTVTTRTRSPGRARNKPLKPLRGECRLIRLNLW